MRQAADYVKSLLPEPLISGPVKVGWSFAPSTQLGGDAFGYHWLDDSHFALYLLDVSGHGVGSSLLAVSVLNILMHRTLPDTDFRNPSAVMEGLNKVFAIDRHGGHFFTIWYGVYSTADRKLTFSGGGHPPPLLFAGQAMDKVEMLDLEASGPPIGVTDMLPFENSVVDVPLCNRLLIYSDGAVEVGPDDGELLGQSDFNEFVRESGPVEDLMDRVVNRARTLRGSDVLNDDCSLLRVEFT